MDSAGVVSARCCAGSHGWVPYSLLGAHGAVSAMDGAHSVVSTPVL
jgi:hypothetical protein